MVRRLTRDGDGVAVVVGQAGAGKTFALAAARRRGRRAAAWWSARRVARRAARELEDERRDPEHERRRAARRARPSPTLGCRAVLSWSSTRPAWSRRAQLARLVEHAAPARRRSSCCVGDHRQLPAIGAGGAFRALITRLPVIELRENRRQAERWERDALALLRDGRGAEALRRVRGARARRGRRGRRRAASAAGRRLVGGARPRRVGDDRPPPRRRRRPQRPRARAHARRGRARRARS